MFKKRLQLFTSILIFSFINLNLFAQIHWEWKSIPSIKNIDSLEVDIKNSKTFDINYVNKLITIEKNRQDIFSSNTDLYNEKIDSLSRLLQYDFGQSFAEYCISYKAYIMSFNEIKNPAMLANKVLNQCWIKNDYLGVYYANLMYIKNYANYIGLANRFHDKKNSHLLNLFNDSISIHLRLAFECYKMTQNDDIKISYLLNKLFYLKKFATQKDEYLKCIEIADSCILLCEKQTNQKNNLCRVLYSKSDIYSKTNDPKEAIASLKKIFELTPHKESKFWYLANYQIANIYQELNLIDSSIVYLKKTLYSKLITTDSKLKAENDLSEAYFSKQQLSEAFKYKSLAMEHLREIEEDGKNAQINSYKDFETIKQKELNEKKLALENKNSKFQLSIGVLVILILLVSVLIIIRSRNKLNVAFKEIKQLQKSREKIISIISHDLMSPINSYQEMGNTVSFLLKEKNYNDIQNIANEIDKTGVSLNNLLKNLFNWSLSQQQIISYNPVRINLNNVINDLIPIYKNIASIKKVNIEINFFSSELYKRTDINLVTTVLRNLFDNAVKNSFRNSQIKITTTTDNVRSSVIITNESDITESKYLQLKDFFNSNKAMNPGENGIGMGLILIKEFTKKMGATIQVSKVNDQIQFEFSLSV